MDEQERAEEKEQQGMLEWLDLLQDEGGEGGF